MLKGYIYEGLESKIWGSLFLNSSLRIFYKFGNFVDNRQNWTDLLDGPAERVSWTDELDKKEEVFLFSGHESNCL